MSMGQELLGLRTYTYNINKTRSTYLYDCHIKTLNAKTCHKNEYKSNNNHNTR